LLNSTFFLSFRHLLWVKVVKNLEGIKELPNFVAVNPFN